MLKEIAPGLARAALVANPKVTAYDYFLRAAEAMASSLSIELVPSPIENAADIERTIESFARTPNGGLILPADATTTSHRDRFETPDRTKSEDQPLQSVHAPQPARWSSVPEREPVPVARDVERPLQTIGYALADSPAGLAAWIFMETTRMMVVAVAVLIPDPQ